MSTAVRTTLTELPGSRVRLEAEVPAEEVERRVQDKARAFGRQLKVAGFRKGKVPPAVVLARLGRDAVLDDAVRDALGRWYSEAVAESGIAPVGDPEVSVGELPAEGQGLSFSVEIGVRPRARLAEHLGLKAPRREAVADEEALTRELEALRERLARLDTVDRPAESGDYVIVDYSGAIDGEPFAGGQARDQLVELGSGRLIPGFEEALLGASAGEARTVEVTFPEDYQATELAGRPATFEVALKEVKVKHLPELDDDLASDAAGFDSLEELRQDIRSRLLDADEARVRSEFREAVLDAAVGQAEIEVPPQLISARAQEMWERMLHTLAHQGITREAYLQISGREESDIVAELEPDAELALRREAVLAAVVEAEGIEPSEEEVLEALEPDAEREGTTPRKLLERLRSARRLDSVREDLAARTALDRMAEAAVAVAPEEAAAIERLWTPASEPAAEGRREGLWTPGGGPDTPR